MMLFYENTSVFHRTDLISNHRSFLAKSTIFTCFFLRKLLETVSGASYNERRQMKEKRLFTDRESGTFGGLMLSIRDYLDRLEVHTGFELNKKPREIDCLIIDKKDPSDVMDNDITLIFSRHNIVELKNPYETLSIATIWKVISYAAQYTSEKPGISNSDVTITILRETLI